MKLQDYINSKPYISVSHAIHERWRGRIVAKGWHLQGQDGAAKYLVQFGKNIGIPKVLALANCAVDKGYPDVANGFYIYAARLEGIQIDRGVQSELAAVISKRNKKLTPVKVHDTGYDKFPAQWQPGKVKITIASPAHEFIGEDAIAFITEQETLYQLAREADLQRSIEFRVDERLRALARVFGALVLHVNLGWVDFAGLEYPTAEQSTQANLDMGFETIFPEPILTIVACLHCATSIDALDDFGDILGDEFVRVRSTV